MSENPPENRRSLDTRIAFRLPEDVAESWRQAAEDARMSLSDWLRKQVRVEGVRPVVTGIPTPTQSRSLSRNSGPADRDLVQAIAAVGNNLNQIARSLNRLDAGQGYQHADLLYLLVQMEARLTEIRKDHAH